MTCGINTQCGSLLLQILVIGLSNGAVIALNAIGVTLVYGAVRMINFAYGDIFALSTVLVVVAVRALGLLPGVAGLPLAGGLALALLAAMALGTAMNVTVERVAFRPFRSGARLGPLIATVGLSFMLYQAALLWRTADKSLPGAHHSVPGVPEVPRLGIPDLLPNFNLLRAVGLNTSINYTAKDLLILLLSAALALLVGWFLRRTRAGRALRASAQDAEMAQLCGVNRDRAIALAFAIGGALAGAAAFTFTIYYSHPFTEHGAESGLFAFTAAVLGGIGRPRGAFLSGLLLGVLAALSDFFLSSQWTPVIVLLILIALLTLRPTGLAGEDRDDARLAPTEAGVAGEHRQRGRPWVTAALLGLALAYPVLDLALGLHLQLVAISMLLFVLMALGLNVVLGFAGLLDLGYAACFALGGYTVAMLTGGRLGAYVPSRLDFLAVLAVSALVAGVFGVINGALATRLRGDYLAIVTVAFGLIIPRVFVNLDDWTGGARGISALPQPRLLGFTVATPTASYYLACALVLLVAAGSHRLARSRIGRAWAALSEDEVAAASCGVDVTASKHLAFVLGSIVAGLAGALFASIFSYVDPEQFDFRVSAMVLAMVVIGGAGSVPGAIVGALVIAGYDQLAIPLIGNWLDRLRQASGGGFAAFDIRALNSLYFGLALYLTMLFRGRQGRWAGGSRVRRIAWFDKLSDYIAMRLSRGRPVPSAEVPREE
jgi:branched-chain amino acid transport system permease protein